MNHPATITAGVAEAKTYLDSLKQSFSSTWHDTERTLQFLMQVLQQQSQQIHNLEGNTNILESENQQKSGTINALEVRIAELENHVIAKDRELVEVKNENNRLKIGVTRVVSRCVEFQKKMEEAKANYEIASAEAASLRVKLAEAEGQAATMAAEGGEGDGPSNRLSDEQLKNMEAALKKELEARNSVVRKAAQEAIEPLRNAYVASLFRVKELEEQLHKFQSNGNVVTHTSAGSSGANDEEPSSGPGTLSHIVSGKYRPKASPVFFGQDDNNVAAGSHPAAVATPPPLSYPSLVNPFPSSTIPAHEVIDLTQLDELPNTAEDENRIIEGATLLFKRKRVESDNATLSPLETHSIQSKAHRPMQDRSQPSDIYR